VEMADKIKKLRNAKGYTQEELGKKLGVKKAAIQKYEKGTVENLKRSTIKLLADALDTTPSYLMGWEEFDERFDSSELSKEVKLIEDIQKLYGKGAVELLNNYLELNETGKEKACEYVSDLTENVKYID